MLTRIDRVQLAVPDRAAAAARWTALLDAEPAGEDAVKALGARRASLRLGRGWIELLEPDGAGPLDDAVRRRGPHLFAAGAATPELAALRAHLRGQGIAPVEAAGQLYLTPEQAGGFGLRLVASTDRELAPVGLIDTLYEATVLVPDAAAATRACAARFALDPAPFVPISSPKYGYGGTLTLFHPDRLHRFEIVTPTDPTKTMGRFFGRFGPGLYMAFAETGRLPEIEDRARARGDGFTPVRPIDRPTALTSDEVFLHPPTLGGMMLGLSRPTMAWTWSGRPERVVPVG
jgi:hypothetical protein